MTAPGKAARTAKTQRHPQSRALADVLADLDRRGTKATRDGMARYGIEAPEAFGVTVGVLRTMAKEIGTDRSLALALWDTGWYEARLLACFIADSDAMAAAQMDRWTRDFDNWAVVDTACFHLFDRSPHAWRKVDQWSRLTSAASRRRIVNRTGAKGRRA